MLIDLFQSQKFKISCHLTRKLSICLELLGVGVLRGFSGWLRESSWLLRWHGRHEFPRDRTWPYTLVVQSLIYRPMSGCVVYNSEMWMDVLLNQKDSVIYCIKVLRAKKCINARRFILTDIWINKKNKQALFLIIACLNKVEKNALSI